MSKTPCVIVNPRSGGGATGRRWPAIEREVRNRSGEVDVAHTRRPLDAGRARLRTSEGAERVSHLVNASSFGISALVSELVNASSKKP